MSTPPTPRTPPLDLFDALAPPKRSDAGRVARFKSGGELHALPEADRRAEYQTPFEVEWGVIPLAEAEARGSLARTRVANYRTSLADLRREYREVDGWDRRWACHESVFEQYREVLLDRWVSRAHAQGVSDASEKSFRAKFKAVKDRLIELKLARERTEADASRPEYDVDFWRVDEMFEIMGVSRARRDFESEPPPRTVVSPADRSLTVTLPGHLVEMVQSGARDVHAASGGVSMDSDKALRDALLAFLERHYDEHSGRAAQAKAPDVSDENARDGTPDPETGGLASSPSEDK